MSGTRRSIRVANVSGAFGDWPLALYHAVREGPVDIRRSYGKHLSIGDNKISASNPAKT